MFFVKVKLKLYILHLLFIHQGSDEDCLSEIFLLFGQLIESPENLEPLATLHQGFQSESTAPTRAPKF